MEHRQRSASSASSRSSSRKRERSASPVNTSGESSKTFKKPHSAKSSKQLTKKTILAKSKLDQSAGSEIKTNMASQEGEKLSTFEKQVLEQLKNLDLKMENIDKKIDRRMSVLEGKVFDLEQSQDKCKQDIEMTKRQQGLSEELLVNNETIAKLSHAKAQSNEQYQRNFNIRIFNVEESENETIAECETKVLKLFEQKLQVTVPIEAIDVIHRLGPKPKKSSEKQSSPSNPPEQTVTVEDGENSGASATIQKNKSDDEQTKSTPKQKTYVGRPIIVSFLSRRVRREILANRSRLKKKTQDELPIIVVEDLTKENHILFERAKNSSKFAAVWTKDGIVHGKQANGLVTIIRSFADVDGPPLERLYTAGSSYTRGRFTRGRGKRGRGQGRGHDLSSAYIPTHREASGYEDRGLLLKNRFSQFQYQPTSDSERKSQDSKDSNKDDTSMD